MSLPRRASSSLTFRLFTVGFLRDSGYTHVLLTLTQRLHAGLMRSHLSFRARHETQAKGSVADPPTAEESATVCASGSSSSRESVLVSGAIAFVYWPLINEGSLRTSLREAVPRDWDLGGVRDAVR